MAETAPQPVGPIAVTIAAGIREHADVCAVEGCLREMRFGDMCDHHSIQRILRSLWHAHELSGLISNVVHKHTFRASRPDVEYRNPEAFVAGRKWQRDMDKQGVNPNVYISGPNGNSKTFIAHCLLNSVLMDRARHMVRNNDSMLYLSVGAADVCETHADTFTHGTDCGFESEIDFAWKRVRCWLLDDADKGHWSPKSVSALLAVLDVRYATKRPTILTSNVSFREWMHLLAGHSSKTTARAIGERLVYGMVKIETHGDSVRRMVK